jgi:hypothetical protein
MLMRVLRGPQLYDMSRLRSRLNTAPGTAEGSALKDISYEMNISHRQKLCKNGLNTNLNLAGLKADK